MISSLPDEPDPAREWIPPGLAPCRASGRAGASDPQVNWLRDKLLAASRELLFAVEKVRNPIGATIEDQAPAAWHVRTSQALLDHCVEHLDDLDDEDPPERRPRPGGPLVH